MQNLFYFCTPYHFDFTLSIVFIEEERKEETKLHSYINFK